LFAGAGLLPFVVDENVTQAVESSLPEGAALGDPPFGESQAARIHAAGPDPADLLGLDDAALFQDLEVLNDCRQGQIERLGQVTDRHGSDAQPLHDGSARGFRQCVEDSIDGDIV
jgi:hypothetical protein